MNMNFTQSFEEFSRGLSTMDLALYAGIGLIVWILFKEKLGPVQNIISSSVNKVTELFGTGSSSKINTNPIIITKKNTDVFFDLIASWKQTRDLAETSGCSEAVKAIDQLFPYLSPQACSSSKEKNEQLK